LLEIVVPLGSLPAASAARMSLDLVARERGGAIADLKLYGAPVRAALLERRLRSRSAFDIEAAGFQVQLASIADYRLVFLEVKGIADEAAWVEEVARRSPFVSGRLFDPDYEHWQNAEDPILYTGRSMDGLPMRHNGLPPPLDKMIVDISGNPGRRVLRDGHIEAIGHRMWLGPEFFARVPGADRRSILAASDLQVTERPDGLIEIVAADAPFADTTTAAAQDRLRRLLFPSSSGEERGAP
jgi:hypothetical protein